MTMYQCDNCGWWRRRKWRLYEWLFNIRTPLGECTEPTVEELTWHSHVCPNHTSRGKDKEGVLSSVVYRDYRRALMDDEVLEWKRQMDEWRKERSMWHWSNYNLWFTVAIAVVVVLWFLHSEGIL